MKFKLFAIISALALVLIFTGCGNATSKNNPDNIISDIKSDVQSSEERLESGLQSGESKLESGINSTESKVESNISATDTKITKEKAKEIALEDAKLKEIDIRNYKIRLDRDDGILVYELEFDHGTYEYDYEIDATTGTIRERDKDYLD